jgi:hypothetical protein
MKKAFIRFINDRVSTLPHASSTVAEKYSLEALLSSYVQKYW